MLEGIKPFYLFLRFFSSSVSFLRFSRSASIKAVNTLKYSESVASGLVLFITAAKSADCERARFCSNASISLSLFAIALFKSPFFRHALNLPIILSRLPPPLLKARQFRLARLPARRLRTPPQPPLRLFLRPKQCIPRRKVLLYPPRVFRMCALWS